jgi:hypothetical protein
MKLTGSVTEDEYRGDLIGSKRFLFESSQGASVLRALSQICSNIRTAYVLAHTPEQGEDIFRILVNGESIVGFDLQQGDGERVASNVSVTSVKDYERMLHGREGRLRLAVALDLSKKDISGS